MRACALWIVAAVAAGAEVRADPAPTTPAAPAAPTPAPTAAPPAPAPPMPPLIIYDEPELYTYRWRGMVALGLRSGDLGGGRFTASVGRRLGRFEVAASAVLGADATVSTRVGTTEWSETAFGASVAFLILGERSRLAPSAGLSLHVASLDDRSGDLRSHRSDVSPSFDLDLSYSRLLWRIELGFRVATVAMFSRPTLAPGTELDGPGSFEIELGAFVGAAI